jgi:hypothetical protein
MYWMKITNGLLNAFQVDFIDAATNVFMTCNQRCAVSNGGQPAD